MSNCKRNAFGQTECHITAHPRYPESEFCTSCDKEFGQSFGVGNLFTLLCIVALIFIAFSGSNENSPNPSSTPDDSGQIEQPEK